MLIDEKNSRWFQEQKECMYHAVREKLRHELLYPGCALDLKTKDLIGHL